MGRGALRRSPGDEVSGLQNAPDESGWGGGPAGWAVWRKKMQDLTEDKERFEKDLTARSAAFRQQNQLATRRRVSPTAVVRAYLVSAQTLLAKQRVHDARFAHPG